MLKKIVCLMGPTASGKTALASELVSHFPFEIISVDSAMIYRGMDIGTAKPDSAVLAAAPHHLIDIINPPDSYSAATFCSDVARCCDAIIARGNIPLLVGGTMMYFRALQQGLSLLPKANGEIREALLAEAAMHGWDYMHQQLEIVDKASATRIHPHDTQRIQRALEVYRLTAKPLSLLLEEEGVRPDYQYGNLLLMPRDRAWLHERISMRFHEMLANGFVAEVEHLIQQWSLTTMHPSTRCVGYRQVYDYLQGAYDIDTLTEKGIAATRQLAKRQLTWLRHWPDGQHFEAENPANLKEMIAMVAQILDNQVD